MRFFAIVVFSFALLACDSADKSSFPLIQADSSQAAVPWTSLEPKDAEEDFHFVVVTDRTGNHRPGVFSGAMPKVNLMSPAFVVSVGDLIEGYTENQARLDEQWDEMEGFIAQLEAPFFYTAGNHDMNNAVMAETWQRRFGPSYYHFKYKGVLFLVLNSELFGMVDDGNTPLPGPWEQSDQMAFIEKVLAENTDARWTIVLTHQPLWDLWESNADWLKVEALLGDRKHTVFAGHFHRYSRQIRQNRDYIT
ncbi:MAG: metallophosphoesterase, partial [Gammaproteobacteria bacterium]|nr:metallophosphoesterase [Gammaproteobacteria bacterium]